jgi:hypothetical protein
MKQFSGRNIYLVMKLFWQFILFLFHNTHNQLWLLAAVVIHTEPVPYVYFQNQGSGWSSLVCRD